MALKIKAREPSEIQYAHDMLVGILLGESPLDLTDDQQREINLMAQVLCWCLYHDHNTAFNKNLKKIETAIREAGAEIIDTGKLQHRESELG